MKPLKEVPFQLFCSSCLWEGSAQTRAECMRLYGEHVTACKNPKKKPGAHILIHGKGWLPTAKEMRPNG
jgi:hypothetical protein